MKNTMSNHTRRKPTTSSCLSALDLTKALSRNSLLRLAMVFLLMLAVLGVSFCSHAVTLLSGPSFTKATNAPLAGILQLTTLEDTRVSVSVDDGYGSWQRNFYDFGTTHSVPLLGFNHGHRLRPATKPSHRHPTLGIHHQSVASELPQHRPFTQ